MKLLRVGQSRISVGRLFHNELPLMERTFCPKVVRLQWTSQSPLVSDLVQRPVCFLWMNSPDHDNKLPYAADIEKPALSGPNLRVLWIIKCTCMLCWLQGVRPLNVPWSRLTSVHKLSCWWERRGGRADRWVEAQGLENLRENQKSERKWMSEEEKCIKGSRAGVSNSRPFASS